jgi:hypothetical protein
MEKSTKPKHKVLFVTWNDAESIDAWTDAVEIDHDPAVIHSIGLLLKEDKDSITLALNHDTKNDTYSCIMKIPKGMIVSRKFLRS